MYDKASTHTHTHTHTATKRPNLSASSTAFCTFIAYCHVPPAYWGNLAYRRATHIENLKRGAERLLEKRLFHGREGGRRGFHARATTTTIPSRLSDYRENSRGEGDWWTRTRYDSQGGMGARRRRSRVQRSLISRGIGIKNLLCKIESGLSFYLYSRILFNGRD